MSASKSNKQENISLIQRHFTSQGEDPFDTIQWDSRDALIGDSDNPVFYQANVEFPSSWSQHAVNIVAQKYFAYSEKDPRRERSAKTLINRVVTKIADSGLKEGYFDDQDQRDAFADELKFLLVNQMAAFNSPVWFNVGVEGCRQQVSACFILDVEDNIDSINQWYADETKVFRYGSGSGVNLSKLRSSYESLSKGGTSSGPVTFMRAADASAGTIKSGGIKRRAAKLVCLDSDHPDIEDFIDCKVREEDKIQVLRDAGYDMNMGSGEKNLAESTSYQNANNSVRVTDQFMESVEDDKLWDLTSRTTGEVVKQIPARKILKKIAESAWRCADPGLQYDTTTNNWHTTPAQGRIEASNPCAEYVSNNNTSCNLSSLNLKKFFSNRDFLMDDYLQAVRVMILAQEITISFAQFPTNKLTKNTQDMRQLGLGYANLGALLMSLGYAYDSEEGRALAAGLTSLMTAEAYSGSTRVAAKLGAFKHYSVNKKSVQKVLRMHKQANDLLSEKVTSEESLAKEIILSAKKEWNNLLRQEKISGIRNAQVTLLAPTGTISFLMDCDTTGVEPDFSLIKFKVLAGGGSMDIVNGTVSEALQNIGYDDLQIATVKAWIQEHNTIIGAPGVRLDHYSIFDCAVGERFVSPEGHLEMLAAVQPFLSGAISKTINLPEDATPEDIEALYIKGWEKGVKAISVYRDNSKTSQPLSSKKTDSKPSELTVATEQVHQTGKQLKRGQRRIVSEDAQVLGRGFKIGQSSGYCHVRLFDDGTPGAVFLDVGQAGSTLHGFIRAWALTMSLGLQYGMPLDHLVRKLAYAQFEPAGITNDAEIRTARSIVDYVVRWLAREFLPAEVHQDLGIRVKVDSVSDEDESENVSNQELAPQVNISAEAIGHQENLDEIVSEADGICLECGGRTRPAGNCRVCIVCGSSNGCG